MARRPLPSGSLEPTITRLQLELKVPRRAAEACVKAGYRSAAEVAAADDAEFDVSVALPAAERAGVLAAARAPGSKVPAAGAPPALVRNLRPAERMAQVAKPVRDTVVRLAGEAEPARARSAGAKAEPPRPDVGLKRRRRAEADAIEAELDESLRDAG